MSTVQWDFLYLMPHTVVREPIEWEHLAVVGNSDKRLLELVQSQPAVKKLVTGISGPFGERVHPSAMLIRSDSPERVNYEAASSFRNAIAISSIIDAWSTTLSGGSGHYPWWSDFFDFYSLVASRDGQDLIGRSAVMQSSNSPAKFKGQKAAYLGELNYVDFGFDVCVLEACKSVWIKKFTKGKPSKTYTKLFRSLEIACQAMRLPSIGSRDISIHQVGVGIALWVSAMEILAKPPKVDVTRSHVLDLLSRIDWRKRTLRARKYQLKSSKNKPFRDTSGKILKFNFIQKLCAELYRARNDFLHGNPVTISSVFRSRLIQGSTLLHCAPLIYRAALLAFVQPELRPDASQTLLQSLRNRTYEDAVAACR